MKCSLLEENSKWQRKDSQNVSDNKLDVEKVNEDVEEIMIIVQVQLLVEVALFDR